MHPFAIVRFSAARFVRSHRAPIDLMLVACLLLAAAAHATPTTSAHQELASGSALLVDLQTDEVLYSSHPDLVMPIASVTKLMTAWVVLTHRQPLDEPLRVVVEDVPELHGVFSRVRLDSEVSRRDLLLITLMSSENRAAATLAHHYPGGVAAFVEEMNFQAKALGMRNTRFAEPTGLSHENQSSAADLVKLIKAAEQFPLIGAFSSTSATSVAFSKPRYTLEFRNTNHLVNKPEWHIDLTKTGYTRAAGHCLVMRTEIDGRPVAFVVLDAFGKLTHTADAARLKRWIETGTVTPVAPAALTYKRQRMAQRTPR
jgi:serine-type D-Ala-D-Ala endopeptidase (penicillin-binding protein 7)